MKLPTPKFKEVRQKLSSDALGGVEEQKEQMIDPK